MHNSKNAPLVLPSGKIVDAGVSHADYAKRVQAAISLYECDHSDAESIVNCQLLEGIQT